MKLIDFDRTVEFKKKKGFLGYFQIWFHCFSDLVLLNLCFVLTSLPILTFGASWCALVKVCKSYVLDENVYPIKMYFSCFKKMLIKQSGFALLYNIILFVIGFSFYFYFAFSKSLVILIIPAIISLATELVAVMMSAYVYPIMIERDFGFAEILKRSFINVFSDIKKAFAYLLAVIIVLVAILAFFPYSLPIVLFLPAIAIALTTAVIYYE